MRLLVFKSTGQTKQTYVFCAWFDSVGFCRRACDAVKRTLHSLIYCHCYVQNHAWDCCFFFLNEPFVNMCNEFRTSATCRDVKFYY